MLRSIESYVDKAVDRRYPGIEGDDFAFSAKIMQRRDDDTLGVLIEKIAEVREELRRGEVGPLTTDLLALSQDQGLHEADLFVHFLEIEGHANPPHNCLNINGAQTTVLGCVVDFLGKRIGHNELRANREAIVGRGDGLAQCASVAGILLAAELRALRCS